MSLCTESLANQPKQDDTDPFVDATFGNYIRGLRRNAGLTIQDMASRMGISKSHYTNVELGEKAAFAPDRYGPLFELGAELGLLVMLAARDAPEPSVRRTAPIGVVRATIIEGHPSSASWDELQWDDDDYCWYAVAHHPGGLNSEQIAELTGLTSERVRQIEEEALAKLKADPRMLELLQEWQS